MCCATKRQVEINCPPDCVYLSSARTHPPAVVQRRQERDVSFILPIVSELTDTQYRLLLLFQSATVKHAGGALPKLRDEDVAEAAAAAAATLETARKGIIYEHQAVSVPAQRLTAELGKVVADLSAQAGSQQARLERDAAVALRRLEQGARTAGKAGSPLEGDEAAGLSQPARHRMLKDKPGGPEAGAPPGPAGRRRPDHHPLTHGTRWTCEPCPVDRAIIRCLSRPLPGASTSTSMAKRCEICGKGPVVGRNVSHAHNVTPRRFEPNLQKVRALVNGGIRRLRVCTRCLRSNKVVKAA